MHKLLPVPVLLAGLLATGCQSAYYATMEQFGIEKRDILIDRVEDAREQQADAQEQFQTTYEALQALTGFDGGELEKLYNKLKGEYDDSVDEAAGVSKRIDSIETVAGDLFEEWEAEIAEITDPGLAAQSRSSLTSTRSELQTVVAKMRAAESTMAPVLEKFNNYVLALKHQLNAQAIGALQETAADIGRDIESLIARMQASIAEADAFIQARGAGA